MPKNQSSEVPYRRKEKLGAVVTGCLVRRPDLNRAPRGLIEVQVESRAPIGREPKTSIRGVES